ncbi:MAG: class I SAM-dependent methyltransferase [Roseburia sp.]
MSELQEKITLLLQAELQKIILSKPKDKAAEYRKIIIEKKKDYFQAARYTEKQVFHVNLKQEELKFFLEEQLEKFFSQLNAWDEKKEYMLLISKKGKITFKGMAGNPQTVRKEQSSEHNRKKNYILEEGQTIPALVDMGVFTKEGKIVRTMYDKFRQINRFLEIVEDGVKEYGKDEIHIIDFGCGKSYLTFILYYYFTEIKQLKTQIIGLDLKKDVIEKCNQTAEKYGYENLHFELGDINGYQAPFDVDMVVTLHACDTATDFALYNAIKWNAKMIFSVPCCQHELNQQMKTEELSLFTRYGIIKERMAALTTDAIRGNLLEYCGYKTQILEFIDFEQTPKNLLIRAVRKPVVPASVKRKYLAEVHAAMEEFQVSPTLYRLLEEDGRFPKQ